MAVMVMDNPYISLEALKSTVKETRNTLDADYERAIEAASRWIDARCQRHFWRTSAPEARLYRATTRALVRTGDFADTTGMVVEVDANGTGVFTVMAATDWQPEPFILLNGWPHDRITPTGEAEFRVHGRRPAVRVTARWGWLSVPKPVEQACVILALAYVRAKDITGTSTGFETDASAATSPLDLAEHLLSEYLPPGARHRNDRRRDLESAASVTIQAAS